MSFSIELNRVTSVSFPFLRVIDVSGVKNDGVKSEGRILISLLRKGRTDDY